MHETVRDLKANNAEQAYLKGLEKKIRAVEHRSILNEFGLAVFVVSASLVLSLVLQRLRWWELFAHARKPLRAYILYVPSGRYPVYMTLCRAHSRILRQSSVHEPTLPV